MNYLVLKISIKQNHKMISYIFKKQKIILVASSYQTYFFKYIKLKFCSESLFEYGDLLFFSKLKDEYNIIYCYRKKNIDEYL